MVATRAHVGAAVAGALAATLALAACTSGGSTDPGSGGTVQTTLAPVDAKAAGEALARETRLQQQVAADVQQFGKKVAPLQPVQRVLDAHVTALQAAVGSSEPLTLSPAPGPAPNPDAAIKRAVAQLGAAARSGARVVVDTATAISPDLAAVIASVAASDAAALAALGGMTAVGVKVRGGSTTDVALVPYLQSALAGEQAAVYGYGVVGGQLAANAAGPTAHDQAQAGQTAHATRRDDLVRLIADGGGAAVPGAAGYELPFPVKTAKAARRLATTLEDRCAGQYAAVIAAASDPAARTVPLVWLFDAARRHLVWTGSVPALPGLQPLPATE